MNARRLAILALLFLVFDAIAQTRIPVTISSSRVLMPVSVNGNAPGTFILDTGATSTPIDTEFAAQQGITGSGKGKTTGAGGAPIDVALAKDVALTFNGITVPLKESPLIPLGAISLRSGRPLHGVLGYEAIEKYVVEIDYAGSSVTFHERASFRPPAEAKRVPIHFNHRLPLVEAKLTLPDGRTLKARLLVDTGAAGAIVLTRGFTQKHRIELPGVDTAVGFGVGGESRGRFGRLARIEVGGFTIDQPLTALNNDTTGALANPKMDGLIGGEILRRFNILVDYRGKQFFLTPATDLNAPIEMNMTGVMLSARDATFTTLVVRDVFPGSPAADAGIRSGDELRAVDGRAVVVADLDALREQFKQPGRRIVFTLVREGAELEVPLVTRRLL